MKKDIERPKVINVGVAVVRELTELNEYQYNAYVFNLRDDAITNVLVSSRGYGELKGEQKNTTLLRHFLDEIGPLDYKMIEPVMPDVFQLNNEYWVSFYAENKIYDKKFIFLKESITEENMIDIPFMNAKGVMIR